MRKLFAVAMLVGIFCASAWCAASMIEEKLNLERSLQERAERLIEKILGSKEMVVIVNVELEKERPDANSSAYEGAKAKEKEFLPGIVYSQTPDAAAPEAGSGWGISIKKIGVLVVIDRGTKDEGVQTIKKEVAEVLRLNAQRGDAVDVKKVVFALPALGWRSYVDNGRIYWLITLLLVSLFMFGPLRGFLNTGILRLKADSNKSGDGLSNKMLMIGKGETLAIDRQNTSQSVEEKIEVPKHFGFIKPSHIKSLQFLLNGKPSATIALVINYLPPDIAALVLAGFSQMEQAQIISELSKIKVYTGEEVAAIEDYISSRIDYIVGGDESVCQVIGKVDHPTQALILQEVKNTNPELSRSIRHMLFYFEDVAFLGTTHMRRLISAAQRRNLSFAVALKGADDQVKAKVMEALSEGARTMLTEEMNLSGEVVPARVEQERHLIVALAMEMEKAGDIAINRDHE